MATNGVNHDQYTASADQFATPTKGADTANNTSSKEHLANDEVGWYFVEQYYTTLSQSPEKLHLYYSKKSQFTIGKETEVVPIVAGRVAIQEKIKSLDFENCKVCINNVDSQGSEDGIVIQVIGESSNNGQEPRKFVQTFVLAKQPSGYFVLNDILRYINEETEEASEPAAPAVISEAPGAAPEAEQPAAETEAPAQEEPAKEVEPVELDAVVVDQKLEEVVSEAPASVTEAPTAEPTASAPESVKETTESIPDPDKTVEEIAEEEAKKPEEPKDPNPTPAVPAVQQPSAAAAPEPEKPKGPPKPMTWASRVAASAAAAAAGAPRPVIPLPKTATPPAATQSRPPVPAAAPQPAPAKATESAPAPAPTATKDQGSEWQTAETKRQNRPQSMTSGLTEKEGAMAYIKYVTEKVQDEDLRKALESFGELAYFDINRQKNCAFVEFKTQAGYNAAVAANPHTVNGENIFVEQRRPKANAYGGSNYGTGRGGGAGRGRGGYEANRAGSQGAGRGGFNGQSRGRGGGAPRGRGTAAGAA
ncbi:putative ntf2 and rrm domain-containing protein [Echria macrotheca]|uniref:Ntf2 and rrm domain-containing protein n=1 Tax=Echria macrotheca TaxID=438768 RepID=A0AAJ0F6Y8_9PEZI|nr:putative ntf2 and rrm domain-containing protein [Echria macrotheca]